MFHWLKMALKSLLKKGEFGMYLNDKWYKLNIHPDKVNSEDPVKSLDVSVLQDYLFRSYSWY